MLLSELVQANCLQYDAAVQESSPCPNFSKEYKYTFVVHWQCFQEAKTAPIFEPMWECRMQEVCPSKFQGYRIPRRHLRRRIYAGPVRGRRDSVLGHQGFSECGPNAQSRMKARLMYILSSPRFLTGNRSLSSSKDLPYTPFSPDTVMSSTWTR